MWEKKQHLILIGYWGGGGGWRGKLKELLVKSWSDQVSEKLTVTEEKNAAFRGGGVNQNVHWGSGSTVAEGKQGGIWACWVSSWRRRIRAAWNKTHSSGAERGSTCMCTCIMWTAQITFLQFIHLWAHICQEKVVKTAQQNKELYLCS